MENAIRKRVFLTLFAGLAASGTIMLCAMGNANRTRRTEAKVAAVGTEAALPAYTVREYCGRAAVYIGGRSEPYRYIDADLGLMPEFDREQLREGIDFQTEAELKRYIQDITS